MSSEAPPSNIPSVVPGPPVGRWHCPVCAQEVPRLLPNGQPNRERLAAGALHLPHPDVEAVVAGRLPQDGTELCLSCRDSVRALVGSLIRPPGEHGDARGGPGLNDTGIVGAVVPATGGDARALIFHVVDGRLSLTERERLNDLDELRLTYPGSRGAIAPLMWSLYQAHLAELHAVFDETP